MIWFVGRGTFWTALGVSFVSTGILFVIELVFSGGYPLGIPWGVFLFLAAMSFVSTSSAIEGLRRKPTSKFVRWGLILVSLFAVAGWITLFVDQLPCFLGGKGC